jgi:DNA modification methylase
MDIWCLGPHRITCGDSTDAKLVGVLLSGASPQPMVTDPPYGVDYDPEWRHRLGVNKSDRRGKIRNDERADWTAAWAIFPGEIAYVWHGALHAGTVAESLIKTGFTIRAQIVWAKERLVMSRGDYHWQLEPCWYAVRKKGNWTAIASRRRSGAFPLVDRTLKPSIRRKSRSSVRFADCMANLYQPTSPNRVR